ncbi:hypothetical protein BDZ85DRAFT_66944 [Elsinoe ampelina]|uniref:Uncharacterized protein n=1 Tax=Elsinoe ampelina TaxID=302913 RepID=A0A6A6GIB9_9PEZI|nr:hypothetical protein BDZ85DRAFT_66944 [Elsinoe ampelina]
MMIKHVKEDSIVTTTPTNRVKYTHLPRSLHQVLGFTPQPLSNSGSRISQRQLLVDQAIQQTRLSSATFVLSRPASGPKKRSAASFRSTETSLQHTAHRSRQMRADSSRPGQRRWHKRRSR